MAKILNSEEQRNRMLNTPIPKLVSSMALPTVIAMLITVLYNTADTFFVSQINKSASAAVGVVYSIMAIIQSLGYGFSMGASSLISRKLGEKNNDDANLYATSGLFASVISGLIISVFGLTFLDKVIGFLGCTKTMFPYAKDYAFYILLSAPISCSTFVFNGILRSEGETKFAMYGIGIGSIINIILDPIFIFTFGFGCGGASLATAISQAISLVCLAYPFIRNKTIVKVKPKFISPKFSDYSLILSTGLPTIFRQGLGSISALCLNLQAVIWGDAAVSAINIANKVYVLVRNVVLGVGQGFQPVAGYNFGAGKIKRVKSAFWFTTLLGTVICVLSVSLIALFPKPVMMIFIKDPEVVKIGIPTLLFSCAVMPFMAFSTYVNQLFQCLGFKLPATILASCRQGIFFLPLVFILPELYGITGVEITQPASDLLTFIVSIPFLIYFLKKY